MQVGARIVKVRKDKWTRSRDVDVLKVRRLAPAMHPHQSPPLGISVLLASFCSNHVTASILSRTEHNAIAKRDT